MMERGQAIVDFVEYLVKYSGYLEMDRMYLENQISQKLGFTETLPSNYQLQDEITSITEFLSAGDSETKMWLNNLLTPTPAVVNAFFTQTYQQDKKRAWHNFVSLAYANMSVTRVESKENQKVIIDESYGLSKEGQVPSQRRYLRLNLLDEQYGLCMYHEPLFAEEAIIITENKKQADYTSAEHLNYLFYIQQVFPHLMVCYNNQIPNENQYNFYQIGTKDLPLTKAKGVKQLQKYGVQITLLHFPCPALKLESDDQVKIKLVANQIMEQFSAAVTLVVIDEATLVLSFGENFEQSLGFKKLAELDAKELAKVEQKVLKGIGETE